MGEPLTDQLGDDLIRLVRRADAARPRSLQRAVGPSQMGVGCDASLAYQHIGPEPTGGDSGDPIPAIVGVAVHAWLEQAAEVDNSIHTHAGEPSRWLTERSVTINHAGATVTGTCDLYDTATNTVIDWKVVGPTTLRNTKHDGPSQVYRVQSQLYGLGYRQAGFPVERVAVALLPRNGPLRGLQVHAEPFDAAVAFAAMERLARVGMLERWEDAPFEPSDSNCRWCPVPYNSCTAGVLFR